MPGKYISFSRITIALLCGSALILGGCACHKPKQQVRVWDDNVVVAPPAPPAPPVPPQPRQEVFRNYDHTTEFAGCTGSFAVTDMGGKTLQTGRAFNAPEGLYVLDASGRKTGNVVNSTVSRSVLFKPDCGCGANMPPQSFPQGERHMHQQCN